VIGPPIFVLAGTRGEYAEFYKGQSTAIKNRCRELDGTEMMRGLENPTVIRIGTWYKWDSKILNGIRIMEDAMTRPRA
jgi:hypothetical protein